MEWVLQIRTEQYVISNELQSHACLNKRSVFYVMETTHLNFHRFLISDTVSYISSLPELQVAWRRIFSCTFLSQRGGKLPRILNLDTHQECLDSVMPQLCVSRPRVHRMLSGVPQEIAEWKIDIYKLLKEFQTPCEISQEFWSDTG